MEFYNQRNFEQTKYACSIYTLLHILMLDFWIRLDDKMILEFVLELEKRWVIDLKKWAEFDLLYNEAIRFLNKKFWINLKIKKSSISKWLDNISAWSLWLKKLTAQWQKLWTIDWVFSKEDVDLAILFKNAYGHNHFAKEWNKTKEWQVWDSWNWVSYKCDLSVLQYWVKKWLYYDTARAIVPWDTFTSRLQKSLIYKAKKNKRLLTIEEFKITLNDLRN